MALNLVCAVLDRGPADLAEMAVLLAIADSADKDTGEAWPSQKTIARRARQTDRSVRNVLARLRDAGWLTWEARARRNGSQASSVYTLDLGKLGEAPKGAGGRNEGPAPRKHVPPPPERGSGHAPEQGSALEPSQNKELARRRAARPDRRPAATSAADPAQRSDTERRKPGRDAADAAAMIGRFNEFERHLLRSGQSVVVRDPNGSWMLSATSELHHAARCALKYLERGEGCADA